MQKQLHHEDLDGPITISRRKGTKSLRISVKSDGSVRLTIPYGVPEIFAKQFLKSKIEWIKSHKKHTVVIEQGSHIGKFHTVNYIETNAKRPTTKVTNQEIIIHIPKDLQSTDKSIQEIITNACEKALLAQAKKLLPQRIDQLSEAFGMPFDKLSFKKMKSRWGMCDSKKNITLNIYLMQLPWDLIDYVLCHELSHTHFQHHQPAFWGQVGILCPNYKVLRKELKKHATSITPNN